MKNKTTPISLIAVISIVIALSILSSGIAMVFASTPEDSVISQDTMILETDYTVNDGSLPEAQESMAQRFDVYTNITEENGCKVATIYSGEQIAELHAKRGYGEILSLSNEEVLYLINDTKALFSKCDIVRITDINGNTNDYHCASFYTTDYYKSLFNVSLDATDPLDHASFNPNRDMYNAIIQRILVLHSSYRTDGLDLSNAHEMYLFTGIDITSLTKEFSDLSFTFATVYIHEKIYLNNIELKGEEYKQSMEKIKNDISAYKDVGAFIFKNYTIEYVADISKANKNDLITLLSPAADTNDVLKYDINNDINQVVIEVYETETESLKSRFVFDQNQSVEIFSKIDSMMPSKFITDSQYLKEHLVPQNVVTTNQKYTSMTGKQLIVVRLIGSGYSEIDKIPMKFYIGDNMDLWAPSNIYTIINGVKKEMPFYPAQYYISGCYELAHYITEILSDKA